MNTHVCSPPQAPPSWLRCRPQRPTALRHGRRPPPSGSPVSSGRPHLPWARQPLAPSEPGPGAPQVRFPSFPAVPSRDSACPLLTPSPLQRAPHGLAQWPQAPAFGPALRCTRRLQAALSRARLRRASPLHCAPAPRPPQSPRPASPRPGAQASLPLPCPVERARPASLLQLHCKTRWAPAPPQRVSDVAAALRPTCRPRPRGSRGPGRPGCRLSLHARPSRPRSSASPQCVSSRPPCKSWGRRGPGLLSASPVPGIQNADDRRAVRAGQAPQHRR